MSGTELTAQEPWYEKSSASIAERESREYVYSPIDGAHELRLVLLHARDKSEIASSNNIECEIRTYPRHAAPRYHAISYTWGDDDKSKTIICGQHQHMAVTKNCYLALLTAQPSSIDRFVWIDAICIDQSNVAEKNPQVALMGDVYRNAERTLIHLGKSPTSEMGASYVNTYDMDEDFFSSPWFTRMWVIQELLLSRLPFVSIGNGSISWADMYNYHSSNQHLPYLTQLYQDFNEEYGIRGFDGSQGYRTRHLIKPIPYWRLLAMLENTRIFRCSDERDRIFALVPLFDKPTPKLLRPDYSKSVEEVYTDVAAYALENDMPTVLSSASGDYPGNELPSWVPDWRMDRPSSFRHLVDLPSHQHRDNESRAGNIEGSRRIVSRRQGMWLFLRGTIIDLIVAAESAESYYTFEYPSRTLESAWGDLRTANENEVIAPLLAHPGDMLCALVGFPMINVLRPEADHWLFVCECSVQGYMDGEALLEYTWDDVLAEKLPDGSALREFEIW